LSILRFALLLKFSVTVKVLLKISSMSFTENALKSLVYPVPRELLEYFETLPDNGLGLLGVTECVEQTNKFREFHPIVQYFAGLVLDDPNTSNHHIYLSKSPFCGCIFYLSHDGDSRVVFSSVDEFIKAVQLARDTDQCLRDVHPDATVVVADQKGLSEFIVRLLDDDNETDIQEVLLAVIPSMGLTDVSLLERLSSMEDFYIVEAIGNEIARRPHKSLGSVASLCAKHEHFQASNAGKKAVAAIGS
jgi:hypothetical protein